MGVRRSDFDYERWENSPVMKKLLEREPIGKALDKYSKKEKFYEVLKGNIDFDRLDDDSFETALKKTLGEFLSDRNDAIGTEEAELVAKELFGDESYSRRFITPDK